MVLFNLFLIAVAGFILGVLKERWMYFSKTGKHLQDLKEKQIIIQRVIRTNYSEYLSNVDVLNSHFEQGWVVVLVTPIGSYLEYIIQNNNP